MEAGGIGQIWPTQYMPLWPVWLIPNIPSQVGPQGFCLDPSLASQYHQHLGTTALLSPLCDQVPGVTGCHHSHLFCLDYSEFL